MPRDFGEMRRAFWVTSYSAVGRFKRRWNAEPDAVDTNARVAVRTQAGAHTKMNRHTEGNKT
jgi:hypothetical protein